MRLLDTTRAERLAATALLSALAAVAGLLALWQAL